jgi:hypothetical protein
VAISADRRLIILFFDLFDIYRRQILADQEGVRGKVWSPLGIRGEGAGVRGKGIQERVFKHGAILLMYLEIRSTSVYSALIWGLLSPFPFNLSPARRAVDTEPQKTNKNRKLKLSH